MTPTPRSVVMRALAVVGAGAAMSGCASSTREPLGDSPFWARLEEEADRLLSLLDASTILTVAALIGLLLLGGRLIDRFAVWLGEKDSPFAKFVDDARPLVKTLVLAAFVLSLLRAFIQETPLIGAASLGLLAAGAFFRLGAGLPAWAAGVALVVRREIHEGDRVTIDGRDGHIARVGLVRARVRYDDGTESALPLSVLGTGGASVASPRSAVAIEARHALRRPVGLEDTAWLDATLRLCPYRDGAHPLRVRVDPDDETRVVVALHAWSDAAVSFARTFVARAVEARVAATAAKGIDKRS